MEIKQQWIVKTVQGLVLLVLTYRDGYFIQVDGKFQSIVSFDARTILEQYR